MPLTSTHDRKILIRIVRENPGNTLQWDTTETNLRDWRHVVITDDGDVSGLYLDDKGLTVFDQNMTDVLTKLEQTWKSIYPEHAFQFRFLDDNIAMFYEQEAKYSRLFQIFSTIFIVIGCLGLYGLITFIANRKGKEIAVRKTLGATVVNIIVMFSREYVGLITVSFALAVPIAWYGVNEWLMNFENHIDIQWW